MQSTSNSFADDRTKFPCLTYTCTSLNLSVLCPVLELKRDAIPRKTTPSPIKHFSVNHSTTNNDHPSLHKKLAPSPHKCFYNSSTDYAHDFSCVRGPFFQSCKSNIYFLTQKKFISYEIARLPASLQAVAYAGGAFARPASGLLR